MQQSMYDEINSYRATSSSHLISAQHPHSQHLSPPIPPAVKGRPNDGDNYVGKKESARENKQYMIRFNSIN